MHDTTPDHARWFSDVRKILDVVEVTPGLPLPRINGERAAFHYNGITHARDTAEAVATTETILSYALCVTFVRRTALPATTPSATSSKLSCRPGWLWLVAQAEHMSDPEPQPPAS